MASETIFINFKEGGSVALNHKLKEINASLNKMTASLDRMSRATRGAERDTKRLGSAFGRLVRNVLVVAGAYQTLRFGKDAVRELIKVNADFEDSMARVKSVVEQAAGFTNIQFRDMSKLARQMGRDTRFSATDAAGGLVFLGMAGLDAKQSMAALPSVLHLAQAGSLDMATAADIVTNVMTAMGAKFEETGRFADVMAATAANSNTNIQQLGQGMKFIAPLAGGLGKSVEETSAALGVLASSGIQATMGGTALRGVMSKLADPTNIATRKIKEMGANMDKINPATNSFITIFKELKRVGVDAGNAYGIFGQRAGVAAGILTSQVDAFEDMIRVTEGSEGAAEKMAKTMDDTLKGAAFRVRSAFQEILLVIGDSGLGQAFRDTLESLGKMLREFAKSEAAIELGRSLTNVFTAVVGVIKAVAESLAFLNKHLSFLKGPALLISGLLLFKGVAFAIVGVTAKFALLTKGLWGAVAATKALKAAQATGGAVAGGVAGGAGVVAAKSGVKVLAGTIATAATIGAGIWAGATEAINLFRDEGNKIASISAMWKAHKDLNIQKSAVNQAKSNISDVKELIATTDRVQFDVMYESLRKGTEAMRDQNKEGSTLFVQAERHLKILDGINARKTKEFELEGAIRAEAEAKIALEERNQRARNRKMAEEADRRMVLAELDKSDVDLFKEQQISELATPEEKAAMMIKHAGLRDEAHLTERIAAIRDKMNSKEWIHSKSTTEEARKLFGLRQEIKKLRVGDKRARDAESKRVKEAKEELAILKLKIAGRVQEAKEVERMLSIQEMAKKFGEKPGVWSEKSAIAAQIVDARAQLKKTGFLTPVVSSLAAIGGGGRVGRVGADPQLDIVRNTSKTATLLETMLQRMGENPGFLIEIDDI